MVAVQRGIAHAIGSSPLSRWTAVGATMIVAALVGSVAACSGTPDDVIQLSRTSVEASPAGASSTDLALPDVTLRTEDDQPIRLSQMVGRPTVINIWYSSCPPCNRELPAFATVHAELGDQVQFLGVNPVDRDGAAGFARRRGVEYELLRDPNGDLLSAAGIDGFPTTLFVDRAGIIVAEHTGEMSVSELREAIRQVLQ